ncbi:phospholipase A and acyltransferase 4-like [Cololabis saira]|uniref:phospholipase A and acyltransferase 4-like n=1 Tax=Cololabis saira TaxID=129043 RepID=UPI002AD2E5CB|nr:phospholipase A and acyltransferase 4-like [Cololabis saira]XP_061576104.1 phospholipase A and acyltransferase 4-like [Cololabis saira]
MSFLAFSTSSAASIKKYTDMDQKEVKPGDLIEIFRLGYKHWAVYVGGGDVVHLVTPEGGPSSIGSSGGSGEGVVLRQKLQDVVEKDRWTVNNLLDHKYKPRPANDIVKNACSLVDTELEYKLFKQNCEHFATEMRYGKPESRQEVAAAVEAGVLGLGVLGAVAAVAMNVMKN